MEVPVSFLVGAINENRHKSGESAILAISVPYMTIYHN